MTLYELTGQWLFLQGMAQDTDIDEQLFNDTMEALDAEIEEKAEAYANIISSLNADVDFLKFEINRLSERKKVLENNIDRMKRNLENSMVACGKEKFKTLHYSFNIQNNAPSLEILSENLIPKQFLIPQEPKLDKKTALAFIKENGETEWGRMKQTRSIRIR